MLISANMRAECQILAVCASPRAGQELARPNFAEHTLLRVRERGIGELEDGMAKDNQTSCQKVEPTKPVEFMLRAPFALDTVFTAVTILNLQREGEKTRNE